MSKPWEGTGLSDFKSWLGTTHKKDGLVYRGDIDFAQLGPRGMLTLVEFKNAGEFLSNGQRAMLRRLAQDEKTEVRVLRESIGSDPTDPARVVLVSRVTPAGIDAGVLMPLDEFAAWVDSRAYRSGAALSENRPLPAAA